MSTEKFFQGKRLPNFLKSQITFFGGSFNPVHQGHIACINLWKKKVNHTHSLIVIPDLSPWKKNHLQNLDFRKSLIEKLQVELPRDVYLYDGFLYKDHSNPTIDWIKKLSIAFPHLKLSLLMGFDSFIALDKWKKSEELTSILDQVFIASRQNNQKVFQDKTLQLHAHNPALKITDLGQHKFEHLSSTKLRKRLGNS